MAVTLTAVELASRTRLAQADADAVLPVVVEMIQGYAGCAGRDR